MANRRRTPTVIKKETEKPKSKKKKTSQKKSTSNSKASNKSSKSAKGGGLTSVIRFLKNEKTHAIFGVFLLLFTVFLLFSFVSFFSTREADDSIFTPNLFETLNTNDTPKNKFGIFGLYFSFLFIKHWFGVASLGLLLLGFIYGVRLLFKKSLLPILRTTIVVLAVMIWFSMLFAFIISSQSWVGGGIGNIFQQYLVGKFGNGGFILFMLFLAFVFLIAFGGSTFYKRFTEKKEKDTVENIDSEEEKSEDDDFQKEIQSKKEKSPSIFSKIFTSKKKKRQYEDAFDANPVFLDSEDNIAAKDNMISPSESELKPELILEKVEHIPGEDFLIDESQDILIDETQDAIIESNDFEIVEKPSPSEDELKMDDELIQEECEGAEYEKLPPYDPREDLPHFRFPEIDLLENYSNVLRTREEKEIEIGKNKLRIKETLEHYNITIQSISAIEGPTITLYEIVPAPGIRISRIKGLEDDIALSLAALGIRIIAPMPGKGTIGIEVPNTVAQIVPMRSVISAEKFQKNDMALPIAIGKTISNDVFVFDLAKMPHVLMAGATGQGKSVGLNAILTSLLYKKHPAELKFVLVDPKKVELTLYSKIERHYLAKLPDAEDAIITDTKKVVRTLNSLCVEMDARYELLKTAQCRNIIEYNAKFKDRRLNPEKGHRFLPYIVLVFDEFADCIMTAGREVETPIARLAQLARAIGIHLIIATQRPSVNVITGLIKANFPARIAFRVSSKIDSRTILDAGGADSLIGKGDMLISTGNAVTRVQCALVDTPEIEKICDFIGEQHGYTDALLLPEVIDESADVMQEADDGEFDACFADAAREVVSKQQGSTSFLQRRFKLGYNRAGRIMDQLEREKIVGPSIGSKTREVLIKDMNTLEEFLQNNNIH